MLTIKEVQKTLTERLEWALFDQDRLELGQQSMQNSYMRNRVGHDLVAVAGLIEPPESMQDFTAIFAKESDSLDLHVIPFPNRIIESRTEDGEFISRFANHAEVADGGEMILRANGLVMSGNYWSGHIGVSDRGIVAYLSHYDSKVSPERVYALEQFVSGWRQLNTLFVSPASKAQEPIVIRGKQTV